MKHRLAASERNHELPGPEQGVWRRLSDSAGSPRQPAARSRAGPTNVEILQAAPNGRDAQYGQGDFPPSGHGNHGKTGAATMASQHLSASPPTWSEAMTAAATPLMVLPPLPTQA